MFYKFAEGLSLDETRDVVARHNAALGVDAFIEADRGDMVIFNYIVQFDGAWLPFTGDPARDREAAILRECRGLTFDKASGAVAIRKFHKFWNCGQNAESQIGVIDWSQPHDILVKEDGSMITPYPSGTGWAWHTKMGATDVAALAQNFVQAHPQYDALADLCRARGLTPLFEFCSRKQRIVIDYPQDKLVLLAMRDLVTGAYLSFDEMTAIAAPFAIPVVDKVPGSVTDPAAFLEATRVLKGQEGYVVRFHNGHMVKIKAAEYCMLHDIVDLLSREKDVWAMVLSETMDDAKAFMRQEDADALDRFSGDVHRACVAYADALQAKAETARAIIGDDTKRFAMDYVNVPETPHRERGFLFQAFARRDVVGVVKRWVRQECHSGPRLAAIKPLLGNLDWHRYRPTDIATEN